VIGFQTKHETPSSKSHFW